MSNHCLKQEWQGKYPIMQSPVSVSRHWVDFLSVEDVWPGFFLDNDWDEKKKKSLQGIYLYYIFAIAYSQEVVRDIFKIMNFKGKNWLFAKCIRLSSSYVDPENNTAEWE